MLLMLHFLPTKVWLVLFAFAFVTGGHGRRNVSADLQMVAQYAAQVAHREDGHHVQSNHSPEHYRQVTSNGNSVSSNSRAVYSFICLFLTFWLIEIISFVLYRYLRL